MAFMSYPAVSERVPGDFVEFETCGTKKKILSTQVAFKKLRFFLPLMNILKLVLSGVNRHSSRYRKKWKQYIKLVTMY